ncbi:hypothetical protein B0H12DRAFT_1123977 [Mycena haematopus]|nr:hypothetical protein B0H12DRAFT_1123977 [Mycena haematopus]
MSRGFSALSHSPLFADFATTRTCVTYSFKSQGCLFLSPPLLVRLIYSEEQLRVRLLALLLTTLLLFPSEWNSTSSP